MVKNLTLTWFVHPKENSGYEFIFSKQTSASQSRLRNKFKHIAKNQEQPSTRTMERDA